MKIINGSELNSTQIDELTDLIFYTGYFELGSKYNLLNLSPKKFQRQVTVVPALRYIRAILNANNQVIGFHQCFTKAETTLFFENLPNYYAQTPDNLEVINLISNLYIEESENSDLIIHKTFSQAILVVHNFGYSSRSMTLLNSSMVVIPFNTFIIPSCLMFRMP